VRAIVAAKLVAGVAWITVYDLDGPILTGNQVALIAALIVIPSVELGIDVFTLVVVYVTHSGRWNV
jgi:hypothetical protein